MRLFTITLFFIYTWGLGYTVTRFIRERSIESICMRIGIGLGLFCILGVFLNLINVPLDWRTFLLLSVAFPLYDLLRKFNGRNKEKFRKPNIWISLVLFIFILTFLLYWKGAFRNPYLEDDDSWLHAAGVKYVAFEKNVNDPLGVLAVINPYPPGYDLILGILHQNSPSLYWTLKFFNILIISLGVLFFCFFAIEFTKNDKKSVFSTFVFACLPCYLSHFIWAHSLVVTLFFVAFYCVLKTIKDRRYILSAVMVIAGIMVIQPTQALKFVIMLLLLFIVISLVYKKLFWEIILVFLLGCVISLSWWLPVLIKYVYGIKVLSTNTAGILSLKCHEISSLNEFLRLIKNCLSPSSGTATRAYRLEEFIWPPSPNMINNPIGIGPIPVILLLLGIYICFRGSRKRSKDENVFLFTTFMWLVFTFLGINSLTFHLPIGLFAFRFWMLIAIPVSLFTAEAVYSVVEKFKLKIFKIIFLITVIISILFTSGYSKYQINNSIWPFGMHWVSRGEIEGYSWLKKNLKPNTKVFAFTDNFFVIGFDMYCDFWKREVLDFYQYAINLDAKTLHSWLKKHNYEYIVVGQREVKRFGADKVTAKVNELKESTFFKLAFNLKNMVFIFKAL